jgi:hypothetical protein
LKIANHLASKEKKKVSSVVRLYVLCSILNEKLHHKKCFVELLSSFCVSLYFKYSRNSDLTIIVRVDPSKSLALHQDKDAFRALYPEDKEDVLKTGFQSNAPIKVDN